MNIISLTKGREDGTNRVFHISPTKAFNLWADHYDIHLKRLYTVFQTACLENSVKWDNEINFTIFIKFIYNNSPKHLIYWQ